MFTEHVLVSGGVARVKRYTDSLKLGTHQSGTICRCFKYSVDFDQINEMSANRIKSGADVGI